MPTSTPSPERTVSPAGDERWQLPDGTLHRTDGPALIVCDGPEYWYDHGLLHRTDGPALTQADGTREWYRHGRRHRADGPALVTAAGYKSWYVHDDLVLREPDKELLNQLYDAGDIETISHVLAVWHDEGPTIGELVAAVNAARIPSGVPT